MKGDPVATVPGLGIRVYKKCVTDESGQRVSAQEIGGEELSGCGIYAKGGIDVERFHASEIGREFFRSVYLDSGAGK